jgi:hypothetical protein
MTNGSHGQPESRPAKTTKEAYAVLVPDEALRHGDWRYVRLDAARGRTDLAGSLQQKLESSDALAREGGDNFARLLLTGHRGCGKTTELLRLCDLLTKAGFTVIYFDAEAEFDLLKQDVSWWNVLLEMIWQLDTQLSDSPNDIQLPTEPKEEAARWLARSVVKEKESVDLGASLTTELGAGADIPFFLKAKLLFKAWVSAGSSHVKEMEQEIERRPDVLVDNLTAIVNHVNEQLYQNDRPGLVIVVDGLEKIPLRSSESGITAHSALFIHNGDKLKSPPCHLVYTMPLALLRQVNVSQVFPDDPVIMPMVHVAQRSGEPDDEGIDAMREVLHKRVIPELFEEGAPRELALASGGHIRDFIRLARAAAGRFGELITQDHVREAINETVDYYDNLYDAEFHGALLKVNQTHQLPRGEYDSELIDRLLVLPYRNDTSWYALHPCVLKGPRLTKAKRGKAKPRHK